MATTKNSAEVEKLKKRMANSPADSKASGFKSVEGKTEKDIAAGTKTGPEKAAVAEEKTSDARAMDVEDSREETSGTERHDLVIPAEPNIPPTVVQERLRNGQNPATGEPWTREERIRWDRQNEQARQIHARAEREAAKKAADEKAETPPETQPVPHVPVSQLTERQKKAMQDAQNAGKGPVAQAAARDYNSPEEIGKREADAMTDKDKTREDAGVDKDLERQELGETGTDPSDVDAETEVEGKKDADEVQADLDRKSDR